ncbi:MAG: GAF domain-containing protein [Actinomycetota bacterium]
MTEPESEGGSSQHLGDAEELLLILREHDTRERIFEAYPDAVLVLDADGTVVDLNRAAADLLGRSRDERLDLPAAITAAERDPDAPEDTWSGPVRITRPDGSTIDAVARSVVVLGDEETLHLVVLSRPPTDPLSQALAAAEEEQRRLAAGEQAAWEATRRAEERIAGLQAITDAALVHLSLDQLFEKLLERLRELLRADAVTVLLLDHGEHVLRIRATSGLERDQEERVEVPLGVGVAGRIAAEAQPMIVDDLGRVRAVSPFLGGRLRSLVGVPIVQHGLVWGVLHVGSLRPRRFTSEDVAMLELVASRLAISIENANLHETEREARAAAEADAARLRVTLTVAEALGTALPVDAMARAIVDGIVPALGAVAGSVVLVQPDRRTLRIVANAGYPDATIAEWRTFPLSSDTPAASAANDGVLHLIGSREERDRRFPALARVDGVGEAWAALPLAVNGRRLGAIALTFPEVRVFADHDVDLMSALALQCSQAMDRARLQETEAWSRAHAESNARRLQLLQSLTARFSSALTPHEVAQVAVEEASASLGASAGAVLLLDDDGMLVVDTASGYTDQGLAGWDRFPAALPTSAGDAIRTRQVVSVDSPTELVERYPLLEDAAGLGTPRPIVVVPLLVDERPIGALSFSFEGSVVVMGAEERTLLEALGRHCGQAIERARLYEEERRARHAAERARDRIERLQALAFALGDPETPEEVLSVLAEHLVAATDGVAAVAGRVDPDGTIEIAAARGYPAQDVAAWSPRGAGAPETPLGEAIGTHAGVWLSSADDLVDRFPALAEVHARLGFRGALAALPMKGGDRVLGGVAVQVAEPREWNDEDKEFVRAIVRQAAQALTRAELRGAEAAAVDRLERSERRYRSLVQATAAIEWTIDPAGAFVEPQPSWEAYTGQAWERHRGFGWLDAIDGADREAVMQRWLDARGAGAFYEAEGRLWHATSAKFRHFVSRAAPVRDAEGRILEWVGTVVDVHEQRAAELAAAERERAARQELEAAGDRLSYLATASTILASSLDANATLQRLADLAIPRLADWCAIDMLDPDGTLRLVAVAHVDPAKVQLALDLRDRYPVDLEAPAGTPWVIRTGKQLLLGEIPPEVLEEATAQRPELAGLIDDLQLRSMMIVPIALGGRVLGAMQFVRAESGLRYDEDDLALANDLAHRAAVAVENARLFEAEREALGQEAKARERLQMLSEAGAAMAESLDMRRMLAALVRTTSRRLADLSAAYTTDRAGRPVDVVTAHSDPGKDQALQRAAAIRLPDPDDPHSLVAHVLRTGAPAFEPDLASGFIDALALTDEQRALAHDLRPASGIAVPLAARGRILGVLSLVRTSGSPPFAREDLDLAAEVGRRAGSLLDNARLYAERRSIADTLQRSLLPPDLPTVPGLDVGARYRPAVPGTTVGGDFYDVFEIDLEHWGVVIGDVVGKGPEAAAMMGLARYTLRTAALAESRPSALLSTLNDAVLRQMPESMFCTACFARVRRAGDSVRVTVSSGGHPLPFVVRTDGRVHTAGEPGTLLGVFEDPTLVDVVLDLGPGDALVLYTDGVTDERRGSEEFGEDRLRALLSTLAGRTADEIAEGVDTAVATFRTDVARDDVAVLVVRVVT